MLNLSDSPSKFTDLYYGRMFETMPDLVYRGNYIRDIIKHIEKERVLEYGDIWTLDKNHLKYEGESYQD